MTALFQKMGACQLAVTPPIAVNISPMIEIERLVELEGKDLPGASFVQKIPGHAVKRGIAQNKSQGEGAAACLPCFVHLLRLVERQGEGLFTEDILAGPECSDGLGGVVTVERSDEDPVDILPSA